MISEGKEALAGWLAGALHGVSNVVHVENCC